MGAPTLASYHMMATSSTPRGNFTPSGSLQGETTSVKGYLQRLKTVANNRECAASGEHRILDMEHD